MTNILIKPQEKYAILLMLELLAYEKRKINNLHPPSLLFVSKHLNVSSNYLKKISLNLLKNGLIKHFSESEESFFISKDPQQIFIMEIIQASRKTPSLRKIYPSRKRASELCDQIEILMHSYLKIITLEDLYKDSQKKHIHQDELIHDLT